MTRSLTKVRVAENSEELRIILDEMEDDGYALASVMSKPTGEYIVTFILKEEFEKD